MRLMLGMTTGALALLTLGACGQSEDSYRNTLRTAALANCRTGANANPAAAAQLSQVGMSVDQLCTCAIDRYMRSASMEQLKREQSNPSPAGLETASAQCVSEHMQSRPGAAPGAAGAGNGAAPAEPAAPADEENGAAEANEAGE